MRARAWIAAAVGGALGAMVAGPWGAAIGVAAGASFGQATAPSPSADHQRQYAQAMHSTASPAELRKLAAKLEPVGLDAPLKARAALRETPDPARRSALRTAASATDPSQVETAAADMKKAGAQVTAEVLRDYARGLKAVAAAGGDGSGGPS